MSTTPTNDGGKKLKPPKGWRVSSGSAQGHGRWVFTIKNAQGNVVACPEISGDQADAKNKAVQMAINIAAARNQTTK